MNETKVKQILHEVIYGQHFQTNLKNKIDGEITKNTSTLVDDKTFMACFGVLIVFLGIMCIIFADKVSNLSNKVTELETRVHTLEEVVEYGGLDSKR